MYPESQSLSLNLLFEVFILDVARVKISLYTWQNNQRQIASIIFLIKFERESVFIVTVTVAATAFHHTME